MRAVVQSPVSLSVPPARTTSGAFPSTASDPIVRFPPDTTTRPAYELAAFVRARSPLRLIPPGPLIGPARVNNTVDWKVENSPNPAVIVIGVVRVTAVFPFHCSPASWVGPPPFPVGDEFNTTWVGLPSWDRAENVTSPLLTVSGPLSTVA